MDNLDIFVNVLAELIKKYGDKVLEELEENKDSETNKHTNGARGESLWFFWGKYRKKEDLLTIF